MLSDTEFLGSPYPNEIPRVQGRDLEVNGIAQGIAIECIIAIRSSQSGKKPRKESEQAPLTGVS